MKILVLMGGDSPEHEVSIRSGTAIVNALKTAGHQVEIFDPKDGLAAITKFRGRVDCVFPILHGINGEDGSIQEFLQENDFKYLGSDAEASKKCFDKVAFKKELQALGIDTPNWQVVTSETIKNSNLIQKPYVLKPIKNGSAIDTFIIRDSNTQSYNAEVFDKYDEMLLEELVEGSEITVAVLGNQALPAVEIIPPSGEEFDYENKYNGKTEELCPPANVSSEKQLQAQQITETVHEKVGARHLSRTDIIVGEDGKLYFLDFNTMPGLTDQSLFPKASKQAGMPMEQLAQKLLDLVMSENIKQ